MTLEGVPGDYASPPQNVADTNLDCKPASPYRLNRGYSYLVFVAVNFFNRNFVRRKVDNISIQYKHTKNNNVSLFNSMRLMKFLCMNSDISP